MEAKSPDQLKKRERLIQLAGVLLMISPFFNFFLSVYFLDTVNNKWTTDGLMLIAKNGSTSHWILWFLSFVVGAFMLKGRRSSWIPVLAVLGIFIVFNFFNLKKDLQRSSVRPFVLLLTNMSIFALVYSQEFYQSSQPRARKPKENSKPLEDSQALEKPSTAAKEIVAETKEYVPENFVLNTTSAPVSESKTEVAAESKSETFSLTSAAQQEPQSEALKKSNTVNPPKKSTQANKKKKKKGYTDYEVHVSDLLNKVVEFEGFGPWARITQANLTELHMEAIGPTPPHLESRRVEIVLRDNKVLKLKMSRQNGPLYIFVYRELAQKSA